MKRGANPGKQEEFSPTGEMVKEAWIDQAFSELAGDQ